jgi:hypothetical protein
MIMNPESDPPVTVLCTRGYLRVYRRSDWERDKIQAEPIAELDADEVDVMLHFLGYWQGWDGIRPKLHPKNVELKFDW